MSAGPRIVELTGEDPEAIRTWAAVTEASLRHEVGDSATAWAFEELLAVVRNPSSKRDERFLAAYDGERLVGTAWLAMPLLDNLDSAMLDVHVDPALRRRRIGSALLARAESIAVDAGRTLVDAEAQFAHDAPADGAGTSGREFLVAHGYTFGIGNVQRSAPLPMPDDVLDALAAEAAPHHEGYRLRSWAGPVPDELVEGWLAVASTLSTEAPTGDMQREAETVDVAAHRDDEALVAAQGRTSWRTVALTAAGEVVAYTEIVVPDHDPRFVYQWGTLVRDDHRGHRLGVAVKVANHRSLQAGADVGGRRVVTWNAEENGPMIAINERMGFVPTARMAEMQKRLAR
ncbi:GNAT superfamily N-acetyltransferase [Nocardioides aromaticivorans]|uniref:GNAT superfamily N-acetyltransferase n=1 Tax=Nocardioides aromaticivorans TaxID=200618 RepID=A0A7Z0CMB9_9ACTN|nr:GNAT family N-acetyltransferase [Nocardioides aromaticivorans]NYI43888.1 GNAT superfamily N-acetyltransferase [Nocardioides aromaticivorans]